MPPLATAPSPLGRCRCVAIGPASRYPVSRIGILDMLKPIDLTVLAYLRSVHRDGAWTQVEVASALGIAQSSVHRALQQLEASELLTEDMRPFRNLIVHAVRYVYPPVLGAPARGIPTAWAHPSIAKDIHVAEGLVWPTDQGTSYGPSLEPLHLSVPGAALQRPSFYELMALIDVFRAGRVRERALATRRLDGLLEIV